MDPNLLTLSLSLRVKISPRLRHIVNGGWGCSEWWGVPSTQGALGSIPSTVTVVGQQLTKNFSILICTFIIFTYLENINEGLRIRLQVEWNTDALTMTKYLAVWGYTEWHIFEGLERGKIFMDYPICISRCLKLFISQNMPEEFLFPSEKLEAQRDYIICPRVPEPGLSPVFPTSSPDSFSYTCSLHAVWVAKFSKQSKNSCP